MSSTLPAHPCRVYRERACTAVFSKCTSKAILGSSVLVADWICVALQMIAKLFDLEDYAGTYRETRNAYLKAANQLKLATGPYKAARDAYVAATATYTKSLYE